MPKITVSIPVYNGEKYLRECLESVIKQTFTDFEVIVIDDKSSDRSREILELYAKSDKRIKLYVNDTNRGLVGNWNRCVEFADSEWIKFVFQDDVLDSRCLEKLVGATTPGDLMVVCERNYLYESVSSEIEAEYSEYQERVNLNAIFRGKRRLTSDDITTAMLTHLGLNFIGEPTSVLLNKEVFRLFGFFNPDFVHLCDLEFWMRVANNTGLVYVPENLVTFRVHSTSTSAANRDRRHYRAEVIDPLLLLHEYAFNPFFVRVREMADKANPPLNFLKMVGQKAFWAYSTARFVNKAGAPVDSGALLEWQETLEKFPKIKTMHFRWLMVKDYFIRNLLWRVSQQPSVSSPS